MARALRNSAEGRRRTGGDQAQEIEHADRHGAQRSDRGRGQPAIAEDVARHADARAQRSELVDAQQGQAGSLALFLRAFSRSLRQPPAQAHGLLLHAAGSRQRDGEPRRSGAARAAVRAGGGARLAGRDARRSCGRHRHVSARRAPANRRQCRGGSGRGRSRVRRSPRRRNECSASKCSSARSRSRNCACWRKCGH